MPSISTATLRFLRTTVRNELPSTRHSAGRWTARRSSSSNLKTLTPRAFASSHQRSYSTTAPKHAQGAQTSSSTENHAPSDAAAPARAPESYYELFPKTLASGPPPQGPFAIDLKALRNEFLQLQAKAHPDLHSGAAKRRAEAASALINEAYRTLLDPLRRAQYLLGLRGYATDTDEGAKLGGDGEPDNGLLATVLEVNEEVEGAKEQAEIDGLKFENDERVAASVAHLGELFKADRLEAAQKEAIRLRYWMNIKQSLDEWEPGKPVVLVH